MSNPLPLILAGGAALILLGGKKKRSSKRTSQGESAPTPYVTMDVPPTQPPPAPVKGSSGKSAGVEVWKQRQTALAFVAGMGVCNCHPGAVDGLYGPATVNAIIAFQICAGIDVDGKWGPQTDAAMKKMLAEIASGQVTVKKLSDTRGVYISDDYQTLRIGSNWKLAVLDPFLEERRKSGKLITNPRGIDFMDLVIHDPSRFLGELVGAKGKTAQNVGYAVYGALWLMATMGIALEAMPAALALEVGALFTTGEAITLGSAVGAHAIIGASYPLWQNEIMAETGLESIAAFMDSHDVFVGSKRVAMNKLPYDAPAVKQLSKAITDYVYSFQTRTYES